MWCGGMNTAPGTPQRPHAVLKRAPIANADNAKETIKMSMDLIPNSRAMTAKETAFVAGPVIRNTKAAAGIRPFIINAATTGIEPVEHTYIGMPIISRLIMDNQGLPR